MSVIQETLSNLIQFPKNLFYSIVRHGKPNSGRTKSQTIFSNLFLHAHSVRVHRFTLKPTFTFGLGVMALTSFIVASVTGVLLMVYYIPSVDVAYATVKDINYIVPLGRLIRNAHRWSANIMLVTVFLHMARVFYTAAYKGGRAFNWLIGVVLLVVTFVLSFTGYLLPWDQLAYWAIVIGSNIAASLRELTDAVGLTSLFDIGGLQKLLLLGSNEIGQSALIRFYWLHCIILPIALTVVFGMHMWRVRKDGGLVRPSDLTQDELEGTPEPDLSEAIESRGAEKTYGLMCVVKGKTPAVNNEEVNTVSSWPHLLRSELLAGLIITAIIFVIAYYFNAPLKEMANPNVPENPAKAPWYFLGLQELVSYSAFMGGIGIPTLVIISLALIPFFDREEQVLGRWFDNKDGVRVVITSIIFTLIVILGLLTFTVSFGWLRNWFPDIPQIIITFVNPGTILVAIVFAWSIIAALAKNSTRMGMIALFTCFLVAFVVLSYFALVHRGPNWDFYWSKSQWPVH